MIRKQHIYGALSLRIGGGVALIVLSAILLLAGCDGEQGPPGPTGPQGPPGSYPVITVHDHTITIQDAIDSLPVSGGTVLIKAGTYTISQGIHIDRSGITVMGESGTIIRLGDHVNQPVILVGSDDDPPDDSVGTIRISGLEIDGNRAGQDTELDPARNWLRNNGISLINARNVWIRDVDIHHTVSGGLVATYDCRRVFINGISCHHNAFDGIALYTSRDMFISGFICYENDAAGISLDNELSFVLFADGMIRDHGDVGIFARNSDDIGFHDLIIAGNGSHGCFLGRDMAVTDGGVNRSAFQGCSFLDNDGHGLWLADSLSINNTVSGCLFSGNALDSIHTDTGAALYLEGNIFQ